MDRRSRERCLGMRRRPLRRPARLRLRLPRLCGSRLPLRLRGSRLLLRLRGSRLRLLLRGSRRQSRLLRRTSWRRIRWRLWISRRVRRFLSRARALTDDRLQLFECARCTRTRANASRTSVSARTWSSPPTLPRTPIALGGTARLRALARLDGCPSRTSRRSMVRLRSFVLMFAFANAVLRSQLKSPPLSTLTPQRRATSSRSRRTPLSRWWTPRTRAGGRRRREASSDWSLRRTSNTVSKRSLTPAASPLPLSTSSLPLPY